jgi:predicted enzyme related to lactoylglutathione lyase/GNAT superfamily N-acetyltransferase
VSTILQNHYVLAVHDVKKSSRFYVDVLGFAIAAEPPGWIFVKKDKCLIMLGECPNDMPASELGCHNYFAYLRIDDVDGYHRRIQQAGGEFISDIADKPWGMREFGIKTPDGHRIMIGQTLVQADNNVVIRSAITADAARMCEVFTRSVQEVCGPDYGNDAEILDSWCANKQPEIVAEWIGNADNFFVVAELHPHGIVGAAMYKRSEASVYLCYVVPEGLHRGVGSQLLAAMEAEAKRLGHAEIILNSTITAQAFYKRHGYLPDGPSTFWGKIRCFPMRKSLITT